MQYNPMLAFSLPSKTILLVHLLFVVYFFPDSMEDADDEVDSETVTSETDSGPAVKRPVRRLTEVEVDKYDIRDVVIPLPGFNIELPDNQV